MSTPDSTPTVVFKNPPRVRRRRAKSPSRIFNEAVRDQLRSNPGEWATFHTAKYNVPTKKWREDNPGFEFYVANVTERDEDGEFVGEKKYEVYSRFNSEDAPQEEAPQEEPQQEEPQQEQASDEGYSPALSL